MSEPSGSTVPEQEQAVAPPGVDTREVRILEGPNLYFTKPAVKITLDLPGLLDAPEPVAVTVGQLAGLQSGRPGSPGSQQRQRFALRVAERAVRRLAAASGTSRLGVRSRPGQHAAEVVVAFVWRRRGRARALGEAAGPLILRWLEVASAGVTDRERQAQAAEEAVVEGALSVTRSEPGERALAITARVPVASITGTNGKTTTTRLLAHLCMTAGLRTAWSSTDGVVAQGEMVEPGDYSGPAGARAVLDTEGLQIAILETARGGMLLRGMGVLANDVSVVTNVSADHLGMQGIDTLDQLAEVKAIVTRVTRPGGWTVLNGDDPRVWPMRTRSKARPWAFSLTPESPSLREATMAGGRGITVLDGQITVLFADGDVDRLVDVVDVPVTLSGLSAPNIANALAATAAGLGLGLSRESVVRGLRSFAPDDQLNPGRMNTYTVPLDSGGEATVILDLAHNEAGLEALMDVSRGLTAPGARVHLGLGLAGDRTDDLLESMGEMAGLRADHVVAAHKAHYLRGRTMEDLEHYLRIGLARAGVAEIESYDTELAGLQALVAAAAEGDVVALMCHAERPQVLTWLRELGAVADDPTTLRRKVIRARGQHEFELEIAAVCDLEPGPAQVAAARTLLDARPADARLRFEYAGSLDGAGRDAEAVPEYRQAMDAGLGEPHRHRAQIQLASSLRVLGRTEEALTVLDLVAAERPDSPAVTAFRALVLADLGRGSEAVGDLVQALLALAGDPDSLTYQQILNASAAELRSRA